MIVPGRPILFAAAALALLLVAAIVVPELVAAALATDVLLIAAFLLEGRMLRRDAVTVHPEGWTRLQIDRAADLIYRLENRGRRALIVGLRQPLPAAIEAETDALEVRVEPGEIVRAALSVTPRQRGRVVIPPAEVDLRFPGGLSRRRFDLAEPVALSVYPNLESLKEYDTLQRSHALRQLGIHRQRMIGAGREFDQLRDYVPDDDYGDIDWKATARHRKPITTVYQAERSQDVLLCLDCGRMMGNPVGKGTALDRAIDASIMLAHVCQRQGDRVGLALFRDSVHRFFKPKSGGAAVNRIIQELVDAFPEGVFPSYAALVSTLRASHKRRSIVFLFTDLNDPQLAANLAEVLPLISVRHVAVVVSLRDPLMERIAAGPAKDGRELYQVLAARELAAEREAHARELIKAGVQVLEAPADALSLAVINRYLAIKTRQLV